MVPKTNRTVCSAKSLLLYTFPELKGHCNPKEINKLRKMDIKTAFLDGLGRTRNPEAYYYQECNRNTKRIAGIKYMAIVLAPS